METRFGEAVTDVWNTVGKHLLMWAEIGYIVALEPQAGIVAAMAGILISGAGILRQD